MKATDNNNKPDKNVEFPPYELLIEEYFMLVCSMIGHKFVLVSKGRYKQEVCERCGLTGETMRKL